MGYFRLFFTDQTFFLPCSLPYKLKKKFKSFKLLFIENQKNGDSVKNESASTKLQWRETPPPSSLFRVKINLMPVNAKKNKLKSFKEPYIKNSYSRL